MLHLARTVVFAFRSWLLCVVIRYIYNIFFSEKKKKACFCLPFLCVVMCVSFAFRARLFSFT